MQRRAYLFLPIDGKDMAVAVIDHIRENGADTYRFRYGKQYLSHPSAYSIDPRQLPLSDKVFQFPSLPLAIQDNGPDDFGRYLYTHIHGRVPESELDYHLENGVHGIGALGFSETSGPPSHRQLGASLASIEELVDAFKAIEKRQPLPKRLEQILLQGSSLAGARPKALLDDGQAQWIVKFNRPNDVFNIAIAEHAALKAAENAGINVAESKVIHLGRDTVFMTKRFDRDGRRRKHYLSALTLMGGHASTVKNFYEVFSYSALSHLIKVISNDPINDRRALFKRLLFNVFCGNSDDHLKNHGFLKVDGENYYALSPCFDVVPGANSAVHAIGVGMFGPIGNVENAKSCYQNFCIEPSELNDLIFEVAEAALSIPSIAEELGMDTSESALIRQVIENRCSGVLSKA